jgi:hypothetical protein
MRAYTRDSCIFRTVLVPPPVSSLTVLCRYHHPLRVITCLLPPPPFTICHVSLRTPLPLPPTITRRRVLRLDSPPRVTVCRAAATCHRVIVPLVIVSSFAVAAAAGAGGSETAGPHLPAEQGARPGDLHIAVKSL